MSNRRNFIKNTAIGLAGGLATFSLLSRCQRTPKGDAKAGLDRSLSMYINWAAYDELSDNVRLDETLAMQQLNELVRLKKAGVRFDYYLMDAFWFDARGGYRTWRKGDWGDEGQTWIKACQQNGLKPGLWLSTNLMVAGDGYRFLEVIPEWADSLCEDGKTLSLFEGGYLPHLLETLRIHAKAGIQAFKFDFADFGAATAEGKKQLSPEQIREKNTAALWQGLKSFRSEFPDVKILAYNGYGGQYNNTYEPFRQTVDAKWLEVFDSLYCGDPRLADIPTANFWRSKDIYSDHMVHNYLQNQVPMHRIDNSAFMIGKTGTCYYRGKSAWKGMALLSMARGGMMNTYYGNLELLDEADAHWFAKAQQLFYPIQATKQVKMIGGVPGRGELYGYELVEGDSRLWLLLNPQQAFVSYPLPEGSAARLLFADEGFAPVMEGGSIQLGPEQLVLVGFGRYAEATYDLGKGDMGVVPTALQRVEVDFVQAGHNRIQGSFTPASDSGWRLIFRQLDANGQPHRLSGGAPPKGTTMGNILVIGVEQEGKPVPIEIGYDKAIWSGLSWAVATMPKGVLLPNKPVIVSFQSTDQESYTLKGEVFQTTDGTV